MVNTLKTSIVLSGIIALCWLMSAQWACAGEADNERFDLYRNQETLLEKISLDSLESYSLALEAFDGRFSGTTSNEASADWLATMFSDFGYDSIVFQNFSGSVNGLPTLCRNIIVVKPGVTYPRYQIIIGGHFDTVEDCPGADDNGSGTVAVLEIARALQDVETNLTFIFILFDGEEEGMLGSWYYARLAADARDHIVLMFNLDMIAHIENDSDAWIYGNNDSYVQRWIDLADSLPSVGITSHIFGRGTDSYPFVYFGYDFIDIYEYIGTPYYHTPHDSTVYLNYDYLRRMTQASLATVWTIDEDYIPQPELFMNHTCDFSGNIYPGQAIPVELIIEELGGALVIPGTVQLHYAVNDVGYVTSTMHALGDNLYTDTLPILACHDSISYYFSAEGSQTGVQYFPYPDSAFRFHAATDMTILFEDDFSIDRGWTVTGGTSSGMWERVKPNPLGWWGTPADDYEGSGMCYVTDNRLGYDVDGETSLTSPVIELAEKDALIRYARWFSNHTGPAPYADVFRILISGNHGASWNVVGTVGPVEQAAGGWYLSEFFVSDFITPPDELLIRFVASDTGGDSQIEAAVDVVEVRQFAYGPRIVTGSLPAWNAGFAFEQQLQAVSCGGQLTWQDTYGHLEGTGLSVSEAGVVNGVALTSGVIFFSVTVSGEDNQFDTRTYSLNIHPPLAILTHDLPIAVVGEAYSYNLASTGGTGERLWIDPTNALEGSGLTLGSDGHLSGTPTDTATVTLTTRVEDTIGDSDECTLILQILRAFTCGDANGDGAANVGDAVFLIAYVFNGGAAPNPIQAGDANCDLQANVGDAVYVINYVFKGGPPPCCP